LVGGDQVEAEYGIVGPTLLARLADVIGPAAASVRVHSRAEADAIAASRDADAVTIGTDVLFRSGRFRPETREGFGLLVHESVHVAESLRPGAEQRRSSPLAVADEESKALRQERAVRRLGEWPDPTGWSPSPATSPLARGGESSPVPAPAVRALAAAGDRDLNPAPVARALDYGDLRQQVHRDLVSQIRTDFERGA
jgi:hypothetical protein